MNGKRNEMFGLREDLGGERPAQSYPRALCLPSMREPQEAQVIGIRQQPQMRPRGMAARVGAALVAAVCTAAWAIPYSFRFRGYNAIGGEWILIFAAGAIAFWAVGRFARFCAARNKNPFGRMGGRRPL